MIDRTLDQGSDLSQSMLTNTWMRRDALERGLSGSDGSNSARTDAKGKWQRLQLARMTVLLLFGRAACWKKERCLLIWRL